MPVPPKSLKHQSHSCSPAQCSVRRPSAAPFPRALRARLRGASTRYSENPSLRFRLARTNSTAPPNVSDQPEAFAPAWLRPQPTNRQAFRPASRQNRNLSAPALRHPEKEISRQEASSLTPLRLPNSPPSDFQYAA